MRTALSRAWAASLMAFVFCVAGAVLVSAHQPMIGIVLVLSASCWCLVSLHFNGRVDREADWPGVHVGIPAYHSRRLGRGHRSGPAGDGQQEDT